MSSPGELQASDCTSQRSGPWWSPAKTADGDAAPSGPRGQERAALLLAANPGETPRRLRDAASGGELSRLLLALRNVLRDADVGRVRLFDESYGGDGE